MPLNYHVCLLRVEIKKPRIKIEVDKESVTVIKIFHGYWIIMKKTVKKWY